MNLCSHITIFEGVDGSGKTTAAKQFADTTDAEYHHFGPCLGMSGREIIELYLSAMTSALSGTRRVVMDRSWISEEPYGRVFRGGIDRFTYDDKQQLSSIAMRCGAVVVYCDPGINKCLEAWSSGRDEMVDKADDIRQIHGTYLANQTVHLPVVNYNWTSVYAPGTSWENHAERLYVQVHNRRTSVSPVNVSCVGDCTNPNFVTLNKTGYRNPKGVRPDDFFPVAKQGFNSVLIEDANSIDYVLEGLLARKQTYFETPGVRDVFEYELRKRSTVIETNK